jgi:hypothetical protein
VRSSRVREYVHVDLAGEAKVEETEIVAEAVEHVQCRWCGSDAIDLVPRPGSDVGSGIPDASQAADPA